MSVEAFLDTNVLIYAVSSASSERQKKEKALELIEHIDFGLSAQVLQEFYVNVTRKIARPLDAAAAMDLLEQFRSFPIVWTDYPLIVAGVEGSLRWGISYWDAAIVAAAESLGAAILYTEDLNHGQHYGSVQAIDPFLPGRPENVFDAGGSGYG